ncbi:MAG TPA: hypothetical protein VLB44_19460 [Kofleriaceae bacterium]|nr:hypothetical protein [Kofleriaceae bacterium]
MHKDVLRLAALLACVALATSRFGLIGHELVGHGGAALAVGARIDRVQLFWFAGGWIRYHLTEPSQAAALTIAMAGIAVELIVGVTLWLAVRRTTLGGRITRGIGAALVVHASWYLATGAWHGFGDGLVLYRMLGAGRAPVAIAAGLVTCGAAFLGAREVLGALAKTIHGSRRARVIGTAIALVLAAGFHAGLTTGELALRRDPTYAETMQPERERVIAQELEQWRSEQAARGVEVSPEAQRDEQTHLAKVHRTVPFLWILAIATALAGLAGARRAKPGSETKISSRLLVLAAAIAIGAVWLVITIDGLVM